MKVIVVGAGVIGLSTARALLALGHEVVCLDSGHPMRARSTGDSRIFRLAHTDPALVERASEARELWNQWAEAAGETLVGHEGLVVTGPSALAMAAGMTAAGVAVETPPSLPEDMSLPGAVHGPIAIDRGAGVIRVWAVRRHLVSCLPEGVVRDRVEHLDPQAATVVTAAGVIHAADAVIVAAGADTGRLAALVGITLPSLRVRHSRYTFRLRDAAASPPCWIETAQHWRTGYTTYGLSSGPGLWAIGGSLPDADKDYALGADEVARRSLEALTQYLEASMPGVDPTPLDHIDCDLTPSPRDDGFALLQEGPVTVVTGDNLFKFAPFLGKTLAAVATGAAQAREFQLQ